VLNDAGNVLGLMPHPEHAVDPLTGSDEGLALFQALVSAHHITGRADARPRVSAA
jgi:phosphoribosylformylglycinamidine synthase